MRLITDTKYMILDAKFYRQSLIYNLCFYASFRIQLKARNMIILGIETSCDDTGISLIRTNKKKIEVLSNMVSSQETIHSPYGGVFPALAKREHQKNIITLLEKGLKKAKLLKEEVGEINEKKLKKIKAALERSPELYTEIEIFLKKYSKPEIDKIAITTGPGLEPCLWVGVNTAKALSHYWDIELVPINHLEGHLIANHLDQDCEFQFPAIGLIVSGGNTQIVLIEGLGKYKVVGETKDDAAGECLDKTARLLGLGYPGGKKISELASQCKSSQFSISLPRPMIHDKSLDFSFSGLKTAVLYETKKRQSEILLSKDYREEMAKEIEEAVVEVISKKIDKAITKYSAKRLIVGGGVSANKKLRTSLKKIAREKGITLSFPKMAYTGDNAAMIAAIPALVENKKTISWSRLKPNSNLRLNDR